MCARVCAVVSAGINGSVQVLCSVRWTVGGYNKPQRLCLFLLYNEFPLPLFSRFSLFFPPPLSFLVFSFTSSRTQCSVADPGCAALNITLGLLALYPDLFKYSFPFQIVLLALIY